METAKSKQPSAGLLSKRPLPNGALPGVGAEDGAALHDIEGAALGATAIWQSSAETLTLVLRPFAS